MSGVFLILSSQASDYDQVRNVKGDAMPEIIAGNYQGQSSPLGAPFSVYGAIHVITVFNNVAAGSINLTGVIVPDDRIYVLQNMYWQYTGTAPNNIRFGHYNGATEEWFYAEDAPVNGKHATWQGEMVCEPGYFLICNLNVATLNDDFVWNIHGYEMLLG